MNPTNPESQTVLVDEGAPQPKPATTPSRAKKLFVRAGVAVAVVGAVYLIARNLDSTPVELASSLSE